MSLQHLPTAVPEYPKVNTRMTMLQSLMVSAFTGLAFHVPRASSRGLSRGNVSSQAKKIHHTHHLFNAWPRVSNKVFG